MSRRILARACLAFLGVVTSVFVASGEGRPATQLPPPNLRDEPGTIRAAFADRSYAPGQRAVLRLFGVERPFWLQMFRVGLEKARPRRDDLLAGTAVSNRRKIVPRGQEPVRVAVDIGSWPSGFYFARLSRPGGGLGFAPLIVRPRAWGSSRVLIVLPTYTWQAYNFRDADRDGIGDTWYASPNIHVVDLSRPYLRRGVPPHFRGYDRGFIRWVAQSGKRADFVADDDLENLRSGDQLARLYDLVVFPGHEEYVGRHVYDVLVRYRDLGGNLAFLSANTFYYRIERHGNLLYGRQHWSDFGRPAALLTGSDYIGWSERQYPNRPYIDTAPRRASWLFAGTGLRPGAAFGGFGIEVDARSSRSPRGTVVLARIPNIFGPGRSAEMTYYETRAGAKVFSAGVMNFGGAVGREPMTQMMENLWRRMVKP